MSSVLVKSLKSSKHCVENVSIRSFLVPILPHSDRMRARIWTRRIRIPFTQCSVFCFYVVQKYNIGLLINFGQMLDCSIALENVQNF